LGTHNTKREIRLVIMERGQSRRLILLSLFLFALLSARAAAGCEPPSTIEEEATPDEIRAFFKGKKASAARKRARHIVAVPRA
jgi:hypothetical protein